MKFFNQEVKHLLLYVMVKTQTKSKELVNVKSKNIKFEEYKKCLDGEKQQEECDNYVLRSVNHEMYLQKLKKIYTEPFR